MNNNESIALGGTISLVDFITQNATIKAVYEKNRRNKEKRMALREQRLRRINEYNDEQAAAAKSKE